MKVLSRICHVKEFFLAGPGRQAEHAAQASDSLACAALQSINFFAAREDLLRGVSQFANVGCVRGQERGQDASARNAYLISMRLLYFDDQAMSAEQRQFPRDLGRLPTFLGLVLGLAVQSHAHVPVAKALQQKVSLDR